MRENGESGGTGPHRRRGAAAQAGPPPDAARLQQAALDHLARFAATEAGLRRVLVRRVERWARRAEAAGAEPEGVARTLAALRAEAAAVAGRMVAAGAVDDAAFANARAARLNRAGRSRRAIAAHLAARGVPADAAAAALPETREAELAAALAYCRRRRLGPFARPAAGSAAGPADADVAGDPAAGARALAALARAGFARDVAESALSLDPGEAESRLLAHRRG
ncbi:RecX family transcriptional regulator [Roseomonas sp. NAR14]|uniref:Regulatory protein RecX n=1 Tax=Roseomonas acroporae TaxID=2937791 RepID=A0A9X1Y932_9PROT|nr:RecX family transcriptional regulator [Roseomonas acroporae]MCK8786129.1 RecX family transcriptional regulator [Roseomonas acroporae]